MLRYLSSKRIWSDWDESYGSLQYRSSCNAGRSQLKATPAASDVDDSSNNERIAGCDNGCKCDPHRHRIIFRAEQGDQRNIKSPYSADHYCVSDVRDRRSLS